MTARFKLISSNQLELFETRLNEFVTSLGEDEMIVDVKFSTSVFSSSVEYCALVHYQPTEAWD